MTDREDVMFENWYEPWYLPETLPDVPAEHKELLAKAQLSAAIKLARELGLTDVVEALRTQ